VHINYISDRLNNANKKGCYLEVLGYQPGIDRSPGVDCEGRYWDQPGIIQGLALFNPQIYAQLQLSPGMTYK
jgi:hypothetical protein